jgi:integrase/recombinase XerC
VGDVGDLLRHAARLGVTVPVELDLAVLRSWLARSRSSGAARSTLARRGSSARVFTAWACRRGVLERDVGALLATPKGHRPLPDVLRPDEAARLVEQVDGSSAEQLRDRALLELLYATGIRVGELCGLDVDDVDAERRVVRVLGKGARERSVPYGDPAGKAVEAWLRQGRPRWATASSGPALLLGRRGGRLDPRTARTVVHRRLADVPGAPDLGPHGFGTLPPRTCWREVRTCEPCRSCSGTRRWPPPRSTRTSASTAEGELHPGAPACVSGHTLGVTHRPTQRRGPR